MSPCVPGAPGCPPAFCGDGFVSDSEQCDDGNQVDDGNGCSSECQINSTCGNGLLEPQGEECDDGDPNDDGDPSSGDGCDVDCRVEIGWTCPANMCESVCGDSLIVGDEGCDDGLENGQPGRCNTTCVGPVECAADIDCRQSSSCLLDYLCADQRCALTWQVEGGSCSDDPATILDTCQANVCQPGPLAVAAEAFRSHEDRAIYLGPNDGSELVALSDPTLAADSLLAVHDDGTRTLYSGATKGGLAIYAAQLDPAPSLPQVNRLSPDPACDDQFLSLHAGEVYYFHRCPGGASLNRMTIDGADDTILASQLSEAYDLKMLGPPAGGFLYYAAFSYEAGQDRVLRANTNGTTSSSPGLVLYTGDIYEEQVRMSHTGKLVFLTSGETLYALPVSSGVIQTVDEACALDAGFTCYPTALAMGFAGVNDRVAYFRDTDKSLQAVILDGNAAEVSRIVLGYGNAFGFRALVDDYVIYRSGTSTSNWVLSFAKLDGSHTGALTKATVQHEYGGMLRLTGVPHIVLEVNGAPQTQIAAVPIVSVGTAVTVLDSIDHYVGGLTTDGQNRLFARLIDPADANGPGIIKTATVADPAAVTLADDPTRDYRIDSVSPTGALISHAKSAPKQYYAAPESPAVGDIPLALTPELSLSSVPAGVRHDTLVYQDSPGGADSRLYSVALDGSHHEQPRPLSPAGADAIFEGFSADGQRVIFHSRTDGRLYQAAIDGSQGGQAEYVSFLGDDPDSQDRFVGHVEGTSSMIYQRTSPSSTQLFVVSQDLSDRDLPAKLLPAAWLTSVDELCGLRGSGSHARLFLRSTASEMHYTTMAAASVIEEPLAPIQLGPALDNVACEGISHSGGAYYTFDRWSQGTYPSQRFYTDVTFYDIEVGTEWSNTHSSNLYYYAHGVSRDEGLVTKHCTNSWFFGCLYYDYGYSYPDGGEVPLGQTVWDLSPDGRYLAFSQLETGISFDSPLVDLQVYDFDTETTIRVMQFSGAWLPEQMTVRWLGDGAVDNPYRLLVSGPPESPYFASVFDPTADASAEQLLPSSHRHLSLRQVYDRGRRLLYSIREPTPDTFPALFRALLADALPGQPPPPEQLTPKDGRDYQILGLPEVLE